MCVWGGVGGVFSDFFFLVVVVCGGFVEVSLVGWVGFFGGDKE